MKRAEPARSAPNGFRSPIPSTLFEDIRSDSSMHIKSAIERLKKDDSIGTIVRGSGGGIVVRVVSAAVLLGVHVVLARLMGAEEYGAFMYVAAWIGVLALICRLGFDNVVLRYVAMHRPKGEWGYVYGVLITAVGVSVVTSVVLSISGYFFMEWASDRIEDRLRDVFLWGCVALPLVTLCGIGASIIQSFKRVVSAVVPESLIRPLLLLVFGVAAVRVLSFPPKADVFMASNTVAFFISFIVAGLIIFHILKHESKTVPVGLQAKIRPIRFQTKTWMAAALPMLLIVGFNLINSRLDVLMIGIFKGTAEVGVYAASTRLAGLILFGIVSVNAISAPLISQMHSQNRTDELQRIAAVSARGIALFTIPSALVIGIFGRLLLGLFGSDFPAGYAALVILLAGQVFSSLTGSVGTIMTMTGNQIRAAWIVGGGALCNLVLNLLLIPRFGIEGAAFATSASVILWNIGMYVCVRSRLHIDPSILSVVAQRR